jgi:hypothetical protein
VFKAISRLFRGSFVFSEDISKDGNGPVKVKISLFKTNHLESIIKSSSFQSFDMNSLHSNSPIEDSHNEAIIRVPGATSNSNPTSLLFGVFDGHGGAACGQVG